MAKKNKENEANVETPATENGDKKPRAEKGTSVAAQAKAVVIEVATEVEKAITEGFDLSQIFAPATLSWLRTLGAELISGTERGLTDVQKRDKFQAERGAILQGGEVVNGVFTMTEDQQAKYDDLSAKIGVLNKKIKKAENATSEESEATGESASEGASNVANA